MPGNNGPEGAEQAEIANRHGDVDGRYDSASWFVTAGFRIVLALRVRSSRSVPTTSRPTGCSRPSAGHRPGRRAQM